MHNHNQKKRKYPVNCSSVGENDLLPEAAIRKKVACFDETLFPLHRLDVRVRIWREQHESMDPSWLVSTVQADLSPVEYLWDVEEREIHIMDVQLTNLQQLRDAVI